MEELYEITQETARKLREQKKEKLFQQPVSPQAGARKPEKKEASRQQMEPST